MTRPLSMYLFLFLSFFVLFYIPTNVLYCVYEAQQVFGWAAMTKTGPNDARHVIWALSMYFFSFLVFLHTNQCFILYLSSVYKLSGQR